MTSLRHNLELTCELLETVKAELYASISKNGMTLISDCLAQARASLAATPELVAGPTPIPLSERLPRPEDCDAEGVCWFWEPGGC